jgi:hypothetical protein
MLSNAKPAEAASRLLNLQREASSGLADVGFQIFSNTSFAQFMALIAFGNPQYTHNWSKVSMISKCTTGSAIGPHLNRFIAGSANAHVSVHLLLLLSNYIDTLT